MPAESKLRLSLRNSFNLSRRQSSLCPASGLFCLVFVVKLQLFLLLRLEEQALAKCSKSDIRRVGFKSNADRLSKSQVSVLVRGVEEIEVGSVALQGDYFSRRLMIRQKAGEENLEPLYTASMQLSITRLLACILELSQGDSERLAEFKASLG